MGLNISNHDRKILRELATTIKEIAALPIMQKRKQRWILHNELSGKYPMVVVFPEGAWDELIRDDMLLCENEKMRDVENTLRMRIFQHKHIDDDSVVEDKYEVHKKIDGLPSGVISLDIDWGVPVKKKYTNDYKGCYKLEPFINYSQDLKQLSVPNLQYREEETLEEFQQMQDIFGDILNVQLVGVNAISIHLPYFVCAYYGAEKTFIDMYDNPEWVHELTSFFYEGFLDVMNQCEDKNLLSINNDCTYHPSGGFGNITELPKSEFDPNHVRLCDMWASAEAQEYAPVSPAQTEEFSMKYEKLLLEKAGLAGYGCCEGLDDKLAYLLQLKNVRRISISPFADVEKCAKQLKSDYIYSWKPSPFYLCAPVFDVEAARKYIAEALQSFISNGNVVEIILADTHTCHNDPKRFKQWVKMCREEVEKVYGNR